MNVRGEIYPEEIVPVFSNHIRAWNEADHTLLDFFVSQPQVDNRVWEGKTLAPFVKLKVRIALTKEQRDRLVALLQRQYE